MSKTLTGTFFNEKWHEDNKIDVGLAREFTRRTRMERIQPEPPKLQMLMVQENAPCTTCTHPTYASAGSEDGDGIFQKFVCLNEHCTTYLEER